MRKNLKVVLVGYERRFLRKNHTNYWPWNYLNNTFKDLSLEAEHTNINKLKNDEPAVYICWNNPDSLELIEKLSPHKESIIIQKLTSFDTSAASKTDWTNNPFEFYQSWHWPQYEKLNVLRNSGYEYFAFGAKSEVKSFPIKNDLVNKHKDRIFWIPWGSMTVPYNEIMSAQPILDGFKYDSAFVGSKWGTRERGNIKDWEDFLQPILDASCSSYLAGRGTPKGPVSVKKHVEALKSSRLCPIIHANGWKAEKGIMDRFWTVFSLGRFGVVDNEGILDFYNPDEVVLATDPEDYVEKSLYYMKNVDKQLPFITAAQRRIKSEYNQHVVWKNIFDKILKNR